MRLSTRPETRSGTALTAVRVRVIRGPDAGRELAAERETVSIGTAQHNDLVLTDDTVSRYHLELRIAEDRVSVSDLGSTNGTFHGAVRIERAFVPPRTSLALGRTEIIVERGETSALELYGSDRLGGLIGRSTPMRRL